MHIERSLTHKNALPFLYDICMQAAHEKYGEPVPNFVLDRIKYEFRLIEERNYAIHYLRAKKLVDKSRSLGYLHGTTGCESGSLVAYFCKITDINPLPPHYYCSSCHAIEKPDNRITRYWTVAYDLSDMTCDRCGKKMITEGFNIPVETFLGVASRKKQTDSYFNLKFDEYLKDIILHEYENSYHGKNVKEYFGKLNINSINFLFEDDTIKQKVYVDKYFSLLHDLEELTGVYLNDISYNDSHIMDLFKYDDTRDYDIGFKTYCMPVFSDELSREIISEYTPRNFSDLLSVYALSTVDSAWVNLVNSKYDPIYMIDESISELISIRENIMLYLLDNNINLHDAYSIVESVRICEPLNASLVKVLRDAEIPEFYIELCKKKRFYQPKATVITNVRIIWCMAFYKVYYPDSFYRVLIKYHPLFCEARERGVGFKCFNQN